MTFAELTAPAALLREMEGVALQGYDDSAVEALKRLTAKEDLRLDLTTALRIDEATTEGSARLTEVVTNHTALLQRALAYRQLYWLFAQSGNEYNVTQRSNYERLYSAIRSTFPTLTEKIPATVRVLPIFM